MTWIRLTHWQTNIELWVNWDEVVHMERKTPQKVTGVIMPGQDETPTTQLAMKNGRVVSCVETPEEILTKINELHKQK